MECTETSFSPGAEFVRAFNRKASELRIPVSGSIDLTQRCNLGCIHCYLGGNARGAAHGEMDTGKIVSIIDELCEAGCLYLLITGGEPLLREDFAEIYRHAKEKGLVVTVFTNGTLITDEILDLFEDLPPHVVDISLYGATAAVYEKITRVAGSYDRCMQGISRLLSRKIQVNLKTILMTANVHEVFDIEHIAKGLGVKFRFDAEIFPRLDGGKTPLDLRVPPVDAIAIELSDNKKRSQWKSYFEKTRNQKVPDRLYNCGAGITGFHIDSYGNLQPCLMVTTLKYSLSTGSFMSGWRDVIPEIGARESGGATACNSCEERFLCSFCPAFFELENGFGDIPSQYICSMGKHRFHGVITMNLEGERHAA